MKREIVFLLLYLLLLGVITLIAQLFFPSLYDNPRQYIHNPYKYYMIPPVLAAFLAYSGTAAIVWETLSKQAIIKDLGGFVLITLVLVLLQYIEYEFVATYRLLRNVYLFPLCYSAAIIVYVMRK